MTDVELSRKDFKGLMAKNHFEKKQRTELKNIEASKLILAAKKLKQEENSRFYSMEEVGAAREKIRNNEVDNEKIIEVLDLQITEIKRRISMYEQKAEDGALKRGEQTKLEMYRNELDKLKERRKEYEPKKKSDGVPVKNTVKAVEVKE